MNDKIILLTELEEMIQMEIERLNAIDKNHYLLYGMRYAKGYVTSCTNDKPEIERLIEIGESTKLAFDNHLMLTDGERNQSDAIWICTVEGLLEWAAQEGKAGEGTE